MDTTTNARYLVEPCIENDCMQISRRKLLLIMGSCTAATAVATSATLYSWWNCPPEKPYDSLNTEEALTIQHIAAAVFPGGSALALDGGAAQLDHFFDSLLQNLPEENSSLLKLLLHAIENGTLLTDATFFSNLPLERRQDLIDQWLHNDNHVLRSAIQSLVVLLGIGYTSHPEASKVLTQYFRCGFGA